MALREPAAARLETGGVEVNDLLPESAQVRTSNDASAGAEESNRERLGDFELLECLGHGAMGEVFKARHVRLNRVVALKLIRRGARASEVERKRFLREAEVVARLQHPHIVGLYETGEADGQPYLAMEYVAGRTLAEAIGEKPLPPSAAAGCLQKISEAVHYAHEHGVLHRDLKPSNIALDQNLEPRVMDFGLARLVEQDSEMTLSGMAIGSPSYMSPEQAAGKVREVSPASDVYALGAILYEAVTGRPPFQADSSVETMRQVVQNEPVSPRLLNARVPRDLETICLKCLEKESPRRYPTAQALADDLGRFLRGEPIHARAISSGEKVWLWCKRRPAFAGLSAALLIALLLGIAGVLWQWRRAELYAQGEHTQRQAAEEYSKRMRVNLYASDISFVAQALHRGNLGLARRTLEELHPQSGEDDLRGFEWRYLWAQCQGDQLATLGSHDWTVTCVAFSPDGKLLATGSHDTTVKVWDVQRRELVTTLNAATGSVWTVAFTPDARYLVTSGYGGTRLWNAGSWQREREFPGVTASVSASRPWLAVAEVGYSEWWKPAGAVSVWNYQTGEKLRQLPKPARVVAFAPDGNTLAVSDNPQGIDFWDVASGELQRTLVTTNRTRLFVFAPDGRRMVATGSAPTIYDLASNEIFKKIEMHTPRNTWDVSFSPDNRTLATVSSDQTLRLANADTLEVQATLRGHEHEVWCVTFSPDGKLLATGGKDQQVMLWSGATRETVRSLPNHREFRPFFSPDGTRIVTLLSADSKSSSRLWNLADGSGRDIPGRPVLGFSADGTTLVRWGADSRSLELVAPESLNVTRLPLEGLEENFAGQEHGAFTPDWKFLFNTDQTGRLLIWEVATGKMWTRLQGPPPPHSARAISRQHLALGAQQENFIRLYELKSGRESRLEGHKSRLRGLAFSPDGALLASGSVDGTIRLWHTADGEPVATLSGHMEEVSDVAFSPDGRTLASVNARLSIKLWHLATRRELMSWDFPRAGERIRFSPDGRYLVVTTRTNSVVLLEAPLKLPEATTTGRE